MDPYGSEKVLTSVFFNNSVRLMLYCFKVIYLFSGEINALAFLFELLIAAWSCWIHAFML
jgi:hypothetical protein